MFNFKHGTLIIIVCTYAKRSIKKSTALHGARAIMTIAQSL